MSDFNVNRSQQSFHVGRPGGPSADVKLETTTGTIGIGLAHFKGVQVSKVHCEVDVHRARFHGNELPSPPPGTKVQNAPVNESFEKALPLQTIMNMATFDSYKAARSTHHVMADLHQQATRMSFKESGKRIDAMRSNILPTAALKITGAATNFAFNAVSFGKSMQRSSQVETLGPDEVPTKGWTQDQAQSFNGMGQAFGSVFDTISGVVDQNSQVKQQDAQRFENFYNDMKSNFADGLHSSTDTMRTILSSQQQVQDKIDSAFNKVVDRMV